MFDCSNGIAALAAVGDDYMYKLSWLVCEVRRHGYELSQIDQKIKDAVKVELSDERVQKIVEDIISNLSGIINVKIPPDELKPAVGDGSENDGEALQAIIDYAGQHGAAVYFPSGDYLTDPLTVPHDVSLYGYDRYQTRLVLAGGAETPMLEINGMGHTIQGLTLDGNAANQVNEVVTLKIRGADILLTQLVIDNSYVGLDFSGTNGHLQMTDIVFGSMTAMGALIVGDVKVQAEQLIFNSLSAIKGEYVIEIGANRGSYQFGSVAVCETCLNLTGDDNRIEMDCINATHDYQDTGLRNTVYVYGESEQVNLTKNQDITVRGSRSLHVDGSSNTSVGINESTVVQGNRNLGVIGTNTESYTGNSTEDYSGNRVSNVTGKDTLNAQDLVLNPENPLTYSHPPVKLNTFYKGIPMKTPSGDQYNVLVENPMKDGTLNYRFLNIKSITDQADITSAIQEALTITNCIYIPEGEYILSSTIELNEVQIAGAGNGRTKIRFTNNAYISCPRSTYNRYCVFMDMALENAANSPHGIFVGESGLASGWGSCVKIYRVRFEKFKEYYLYLTESHQAYCEGMVSYSGKMFLGTIADNTNRSVANDNTFIGCWFANTGGDLIELGAAQNNHFTQCVFAESSCYFMAYERGVNNTNNVLTECWFEPITLFLRDGSSESGGKPLSLIFAILNLENNYYSGNFQFRFYKDKCALGGVRQIVAGGGGYTYDEYFSHNKKDLYINKYVTVDGAFIPYWYSTLFTIYTKLGWNSNEGVWRNNTHVTVPLAGVMEGIGEKAVKSSSFITDVTVVTPAEHVYRLQFIYNKSKNKFMYENPYENITIALSGNNATISATDETASGDWYYYAQLNNFHNII